MALTFSAALSARWGTLHNPIPYPPHVFTTPTPDQVRKREDAARKLEIYNQRQMASALNELVQQTKNRRAQE